MSQPPDLIPPWPSAAPIPVQAIGYQHTSSSMGRPGIITALGVFSIIVAGISIVTSGMIGLWSVAMVRFATVTNSVSATPVATVTSPTSSSPSAIVAADDPSERGMAEAQRRVVLDGLSQVRPLNDARRRQVDELLATGGKDVLGWPADQLTAERVAANVSDSGQFPSARQGETGPDYFVLGTGKLEATDDHAVFFPSNGSPPIRTSAAAIPDPAVTDSPVASPSFSPTSPAGLKPNQIASIVRKLKSLGARLTPAQSKAIIQTLNNPGEQMIVPTTDGSDPARQIISAITLGDGSVSIFTHHGTTNSTMMFDPSGQITSSTTNNFANGMGTQKIKIGTSAAMLAASAALLNLGIAIYLLVSGIMVLHQNPKSTTLHWIYVAIKIPAAIAAGFALYWLWSQFVTSLAGNGTSAKTGTAVVCGALAGVACIYPTMLLFVLRSRVVREYFGPVRS